MQRSHTPESMILGLFPLHSFLTHPTGPPMALLRAPQFIIIEYLLTIESVKWFSFWIGIKLNTTLLCIT